MSDSESNVFDNFPEEKWDADEFRDAENNGPESAPEPGREGGAVGGQPDGDHREIEDEERQGESEEEREEQRQDEEEIEGEGQTEHEQRQKKRRNRGKVLSEVERIALNAEPVTINQLLFARDKKHLLGEKVEMECLAWESERWCWVRLFGNSVVYKNMETFFLQNYRKFPNVRPNFNDLFLFKHEGLWYRGKMDITKPCDNADDDDVVVRCIDTAKNFSYERQECRRIPPEIASLPSLAFKVLVTEDSMPDEPTFGLMKVQVLGVKIHGKYQIRILDNIERDKYESPASKIVRRIKSGKRNVVDHLGVGMRGVFRAMDVVRDNVMVGYLVPDDIDDAMISFKHVRCLFGNEFERTEADVGDCVLVTDQDLNVFRGIIRSKASTYGYEAVLVDAGYAVFSKEVHKMPELTADFMELGARIVMKSFTSPINLIPDCEYYFEIKENLNRGKWLCMLRRDFENEAFAVEGIVEKVDKELHRIKRIPFDPGCIVVVSSLAERGSDIVVHVRRLDAGYKEELRYLNREIRFITQNNSFYDSEWKNIGVGDLVAARYINGRYYRASVVDRKGKDVGVSFLDYGNEMFVDVSEVKLLPYNLIEAPVYCRSIKLSGTRNFMSAGGYDYLESLMRNRELLILHYTGDIEDGVVLIKREVYNINPRLFSMSASIAMSASVELDDFTSNFFGQCEFTAGVVKNMVILHVDALEFEESGVFWVTNPNNHKLDRELMDGVHKIGEYCQSETEEYYPSNGELCFAYYEGDWYRGFATEVCGRDYEIFFVDYGNTAFLQSKSLRKMKTEFFLLPPLAMKCTLQGFAKLAKADVAIAYDYLRQKITGCINVAEIVELSNVACIVDIPELKDLIDRSI